MEPIWNSAKRIPSFSLGTVLSVLTVCLLAVGCAGAPSTAITPSVKLMPVGDTSLAYVEEGRGSPVVFVHGAGGDWRTWEPLRPYVASQHRFISYSRRFHHPNDPAGAGRAYTVPEQAQDLIAFVERLGAGPVHGVGGSYGARVVLEAAVRRPDLFRTVTASEAFITPPQDPQGQLAARALAQDLGRIGIPLARGDTVGATVELVKAVTGNPDGWEKLAAPAQQRFLDNQSSWLALAKAPQLPNTPCEALGKLPMPVLVMEGELTVAGFRATNDRLMQCLPPSARRAVVPAAPHMWYPANPGDGSRQIMDFISRSGR